MVVGGVTEATAPATIQQVAARTAGHDPGTSRDPHKYQQFTIRQTAGRIWGVLNVRYADGRREVPRRLNGDRAYQAEVRFPDGHTETLYMLQGCGNDLRYGGISRYLPGPEFRFEADPASVATPVPDPVVEAARTPEGHVPEVVRVVTQPAPAPQETAPAPVITESGEFVRSEDAPPPQPTGVITFEFKRSNNGQPNTVRLQGIEAEEFTFSVGPDGTTLRYREVEEEEPVGASK